MWETSSLKSHVATSELEKNNGRKVILAIDIPISVKNIQVCYYFLVTPVSSQFYRIVITIICAICSYYFLPVSTQKTIFLCLRRRIHNTLSRLKSGSKSPVNEPLTLTEDSFVSFLSFSVFLWPSGREHLITQTQAVIITQNTVISLLSWAFAFSHDVGIQENSQINGDNCT